MDRKNGPANFRSADDEMFAFLSSLGDRWQVSEGRARFIEKKILPSSAPSLSCEV
nr:phosphohydrolase [uncultured Campylobacter sp.]